MIEHNKRTSMVISRHWNNPTITVSISDERIALEMSVEMFIKAMAEEISHPSAIVTRSGLEKALLNALPVVLEKVKQASSAVV